MTPQQHFTLGVLLWCSQPQALSISPQHLHFQRCRPPPPLWLWSLPPGKPRLGPAQVPTQRGHPTEHELRSFFQGFGEMTYADPGGLQPHASGCGPGPACPQPCRRDGSTPSRAIQHHGGGGAVGSALRERIYCDKWIHDGTCAFTPQGCKYKHEMPHDLGRGDQEKLDLFHGYLAWWKKQAPEQQHPLAIDDRPVNLCAGRAGFATFGALASMGSGLSGAVVPSNWLARDSHQPDAGISYSGGCLSLGQRALG